MLASARTATVGPDLVVDMNDAPGPDAYPIAGYTYLLVRQDLSGMKPNRARALLDFLTWTLDEGQAMASGLGYAPLPPRLQAAWRQRLQAMARTVGASP